MQYADANQDLDNNVYAAVTQRGFAKKNRKDKQEKKEARKKIRVKNEPNKRKKVGRTPQNRS